MAEFRLCIVGLGHRGRYMFRDACQIPAFKGVAACDIRKELWFDETCHNGNRSPSLASQMPDVNFYEDYDEMLEKEKPDIVMVETPAYCHAAFCIKALARGIHVYSDIPSVATLKEGRDLWEAYQASDAKLMTGATTMGWGFVHSLQDLYRQGFLGKPSILEAEYLHDCRYLWEETPWRKPTSQTHFPPCYYCTHSLGPLLSILDEELSEVTCITSGSHHTPELPYANDYTCSLFRTPSGVLLRMTNSFINNWKGGHHSFRVFGTEGCFEHLSNRGDKQSERTTFSSNKLAGFEKITEVPVGFSPFSETVKKKFKSIGTGGHGGADPYLMLRFAEALINKEKEMPVSLRQGLSMTLPGIYAAESVFRNGEKIQIHYPWEKELFQKDIDTFSAAASGVDTKIQGIT